MLELDYLPWMRFRCRCGGSTRMYRLDPEVLRAVGLVARNEILCTSCRRFFHQQDSAGRMLLTLLMGALPALGVDALLGLGLWWVVVPVGVHMAVWSACSAGFLPRLEESDLIEELECFRQVALETGQVHLAEALVGEIGKLKVEQQRGRRRLDARDAPPALPPGGRGRGSPDA